MWSGAEDTVMNHLEHIGVDGRTLETLDWGVVMHALAGHARTIMGQQAALIADLGDSREAVLLRYAAVAEAMRLEVDEGMIIPVGAVCDMREELTIAGGSQVLDIAQLMVVRDSMLALSRLRRWLDEQRDVAPVLRDLAEPISVDAELCETLERSFDESGQLSELMYPLLSEYRKRIRTLNTRIHNVLTELLTGALSGMVQDRFITERSGRFVLPLRVGYKRSVGVAHGMSQSGETVFVEPLQVVEHTNELKEVTAALEREIQRILAGLSRSVAWAAPALLTSLDAAVRIDLACARSRLGAAWSGCIPEVGTQGEIRLRQARHAVLLLRGVDVVGNDLLVEATRPGLVLTGPNAGGKTIALKTLGLAALMVRAGIPLPVAADSRVDFFSQIVADIGDLQTVEGDLSTFSGHLSALKQVLLSAAGSSLVLLDEIGMGTDPTQGAALAQAVLQTVVDQGARVAVTTHYSRLKDLPEQDPRFRVGAVRFVDGQPTYHFDLGRVGESHALAIARRMAFPEAVISRARTLLDAGERRVDELVARLEEEQATLHADQQRLKEAEAALAQQRRLVDHQLQRLEQRRAKLEQEQATAFQRRVGDIEAEIKSLIAALQSNPSLKTAGKTLKEIRTLKQQTVPEAPASTPDVPPPADIVVGQRVRLRNLGSKAVVSRVLGGDRFEVSVGHMKMKVGLADLVEGEPIVAHRAMRQTTPKPTPKNSLPPAVEPALVSVRTPSNTCDLRGCRVDEALEQVGLFLDGMLRRNEPCVYILHGHGTGALKRAVRSWLPTTTQVKRWRPARPQEGGDAYTLVELA